MRLIRILHPESFSPEAFHREHPFLVAPDVVVGATIGNFDGMHVGHQALFATLESALAARAAREKKRAVRLLCTFYPHPRVVLGKAAGSSPSVTTLRRKVELAAAFGFDAIIFIRFTRAFAGISPQVFAERYLAEALQAKLVVVGHDWSFGKGRAGTPETLRTLGASLGFDTSVVPPVCAGGVRISTSVVKEALQAGDLPALEVLLQRRFGFISRVRSGDKRGRTLGFPTANQQPPNQLLPADGVYAVLAEVDGTRYAGATSIGVRPTFDGTTRTVETYLIDAGDIDLYGKLLKLELVKRLRDELRFESADELVAQMHLDVAEARRALAPLTAG